MTIEEAIAAVRYDINLSECNRYFEKQTWVYHGGNSHDSFESIDLEMGDV